jgi:transposase
MRATPLHHIVNLFVWVCEIVPDEAKPRGGRPNLLRDSELLTLIIWNAVTEMFSPTLIHLYYWIRDYHLGQGKTILHLPQYKGFVVQMHRIESKLQRLLQTVLVSGAPLCFADSTMLEVCRLIRADRHHVAKGTAAFGKNWQGWHYGFKLHASCDPQRKLCAVWFTPANESDVLQLKHLVNTTTDIVVGDGGYTAQVTRRHIWRDCHCMVVSPPRPRQTWTLTSWQLELLHMRPKIEAVFDYLKEHMHLRSSFPRSVHGYAVHYLRVLLGYQARMGF